VAAFEKQTGIKVAVRSDSGSVVANQILQEGGRSPADVVYTENSPPLQKLAEQHLLAPVSASMRSAILARYDSPAGDSRACRPASSQALPHWARTILSSSHSSFNV
jgi:iron(III) transport system substrate-binding protein